MQLRGSTAASTPTIVEEGSETVAAGTVLRQSPAPGTRAVLGSTVTLTVARAPEWETTWSQSGSGTYDSEDVEVTAPQGNWRIVVELRPRYLIFGSGSAGVLVGGHGGGQHRSRRGGLRRGRASQRRRHLPLARSSSGQRQLDPARRAVRLGDRPQTLDACRICIFCGASDRERPGYAAAAGELGRELASRSIEVVTGGGKVGLMGVVADAALAAGGRVTGSSRAASRNVRSLTAG